MWLFGGGVWELPNGFKRQSFKLSESVVKDHRHKSVVFRAFRFVRGVTYRGR